MSPNSANPGDDPRPDQALIEAVTAGDPDGNRIDADISHTFRIPERPEP